MAAPARSKKDRSQRASREPLPSRTSNESKAFPKTQLVWLAIVVALIVRFTGLTSDFPVLTDEAIYLRWAEIIDHQGHWFISLLDGKQPLAYWIYAIVRMTLGGDPLFAARGISALAGAATTGFLYLIAKRVAGPRAGLLTAAMWAVLPWSLIYDRMVFTESLVNLAGAAVVYTALLAFSHEGWKHTVICGVTLGLAFLVKSTALLFIFAIGLIALNGARRPLGLLVARLAVIAAAVVVCFLLMTAGTPDAPTFATGNIVLHHTSRFASTSDILNNPFRYASEHFPRIATTLPYYLPWPALIASIAAFGYLVWKKSTAAWIIVGASVIPLFIQVFFLTAFTTRFVYPHVWPWLLGIGVAADSLWEPLTRRLSLAQAKPVAAIAGLLVIGSLSVQSARILIDPQASIEPDDSGKFFGSYVHASWGVPAAIDFIRAEASREGGLVLLTDPFWGVPADMVFAYLNEQNSIRMYETWWAQVEGQDHPLLPAGEVDVLKSHYERVNAGRVDFRDAERVYYVTDTHYMTPQMVAARSPGAQRLRSFLKPDSEESVDVYRLK